jgi:hypothetical protein
MPDTHDCTLPLPAVEGGDKGAKPFFGTNTGAATAAESDGDVAETVLPPNFDGVLEEHKCLLDRMMPSYTNVGVE